MYTHLPQRVGFFLYFVLTEFRHDKKAFHSIRILFSVLAGAHGQFLPFMPSTQRTLHPLLIYISSAGDYFSSYACFRCFVIKL